MDAKKIKKAMKTETLDLNPQYSKLDFDNFK
jgi:hypothetical protein